MNLKLFSGAKTFRVRLSASFKLIKSSFYIFRILGFNHREEKSIHPRVTQKLMDKNKLEQNIV